MLDESKPRRSTCPVNAALEVLGDRWSLLVVRNLMFGGARHFSDLLAAPEGIATNILARRLTALQQAGVVVARPDPADGRSRIYGLTEKGVALAPVVLELGRWGMTHEDGEPPPGLHAAYDANPEGFMETLRSRLLNER